MKIRKATRKEIRKFNEREWIKADLTYFGRKLEWLEKDFVFKALEENIIVGSVYGKIEQGVIHITDLIVAQSHRNKGIGKLLMKKAEKFGKKYNAHKSNLTTGKGWPVEKFYKKLGYKKIGILPNHFEHKDFVIYEKLLE